MKIFKRFLPILLAAICLCSLLRTVPSVSAAQTPVLQLTSYSAINPLFSYTLDPAIYRTGGPFTVSFQWKSDLQPLNGSSEAHAFVGVTGTVYETAQQQAQPNVTLSGYNDWTQASFTFQNVGYFDLQYGQQAGNLLRIGLWYCTGSLYIRNITIKNAAGQTVYDFNTQMSSIVSQMVATGQSTYPITTFYVSYNYSSWLSQQFGEGSYTGVMVLMETSPPTTAKPTTQATQGNQDPCAKGHKYQNGFCIYCAKADPNYNPCAKGHTFENGYCIYCLLADPNYDPCADGHTYQNGYCIHCLKIDPDAILPSIDPCANGHSFSGGFCVRCSKTDPGFDPCAEGHTFVGDACISCKTPRPAAEPNLLPIIFVAGLGLIVAATLLILILRKKQNEP